MKITVLIITILLTIPFSNALLITEVLFDPNGSENDLEFVELFNNENKTINISNLIISTASYPKDAQIPNNTFLQKDKHFLIADKGFNENKMDYWAESDYEEEMTFVNTNGFINILDSDKIITNISWNKSYKDGYSLNFNPTTKEKYFALPSPSNSKTIANSLKIKVKLKNPEIRIANISVKDEDSFINGIQIYPFPGKTKTIPLVVTVEDGSGYDDIKSVSFEFNNNEFIQESYINHSEQSKQFQINLKIPYYLSPDNYSIDILTMSNTKQDERKINIQIMPVSAFMLDVDEIYFETSIDNKVIIYGDNNISTLDKPTIKNIGNSEIKLQIISSGLKDGNNLISPDALSVGLCSNNCNLDELKSNYLSQKLLPGLSYPLYISFTSKQDSKAGTYLGYIIINAIK